MEKLFKYFILFLLFFLVIELLTNFAMKEKFYIVDNYEVNVESPKINVFVSKASYNGGYIAGNIENDTGEHIQSKYLQFDFYDTDGIYVGTEVQEIKYFNVDEKIKFDIEYNYKRVNRIEINYVDNVSYPEKENKLLSLFNIKQLFSTLGINI